MADLCQKWKTGLGNQANTTAFGWKTAEVAEALAKVTAFVTARETYEAVDSTANRMAKDEAKDAAKSAMRDFANSNIRFNKQMTDEDKLVYGIRPVDRTANPRRRAGKLPGSGAGHFGSAAGYDSFLGQRDQKAGQAPRRSRRGNPLDDS